MPRYACLKQMADRFDNGSIVAVQTVPHSQTDKYGIVKSGARHDDLLRVERIVEKPKPAQAPSNLAVVGRYLLTPRVFTHLERIGEGAGGEIQLTDGIARLMDDEAVYAYKFDGKRYDCGSKLGYLQANVEYALAHRGAGQGRSAPTCAKLVARSCEATRGAGRAHQLAAALDAAAPSCLHLERAHVAERARSACRRSRSWCGSSRLSCTVSQPPELPRTS